MRRLFIGTMLPLEQQHIPGQLSQFEERLATSWQSKLSFVRPEKLHITWCFLGSVEDDVIPEIGLRLETLAQNFGASEIVYDCFEIWPNVSNPHHLVLTPTFLLPAIKELGQAIRNSLSPLAQQTDSRKLKPHLTIARIDPADKVSQSNKIKLPDWLVINPALVQQIESISLIESHLGSGKTAYETLMSFALN